MPGIYFRINAIDDNNTDNFAGILFADLAFFDVLYG
jgi:hypothetical protein